MKCLMEKERMSEEEIRQKAREFYKKTIGKWVTEKKCPVCNALNCICNINCIKCNCQF